MLSAASLRLLLAEDDHPEDEDENQVPHDGDHPEGRALGGSLHLLFRGAGVEKDLAQRVVWSVPDLRSWKPPHGLARVTGQWAGLTRDAEYISFPDDNDRRDSVTFGQSRWRRAHSTRGRPGRFQNGGWKPTDTCRAAGSTGAWPWASGASPRPSRRLGGRGRCSLRRRHTAQAQAGGPRLARTRPALGRPQSGALRAYRSIFL